MLLCNLTCVYHVKIMIKLLSGHYSKYCCVILTCVYHVKIMKHHMFNIMIEAWQQITSQISFIYMWAPRQLVYMLVKCSHHSLWWQWYCHYGSVTMVVLSTKITKPGSVCQWATVFKTSRSNSFIPELFTFHSKKKKNMFCICSLFF